MSRSLDFPLTGQDARFAVEQIHRLRFSSDALAIDDPALADVFNEQLVPEGRVLVFVDRNVMKYHPDLGDRLARYFHTRLPHLKLIRPIRKVLGGEVVKSDPGYILPMLQQMHETGIDRQSFVLAIGGGAMLDAVGFASAIAHRGVRLVRMPTTTLSQGDSGLGVKNGINAFGKKNFIGAFATPWAVINSEHFLTTQSDRDWRSGFSEAVKVALLKDERLFDDIAFHGQAIVERQMEFACSVIRQSAVLHFQHITTGGDPFEQTVARPLDFGHWAAHKLEAMTNYKLRHGEAVAIGLALDITYCQIIGLLDQDDTERVLTCLKSVGLPLTNEALARETELLSGLDEFREHLGGQLTITLLHGIAQPIDVHEIDLGFMRQAMEGLRRET